jgi:hypothetical protein
MKHIVSKVSRSGNNLSRLQQTAPSSMVTLGYHFANNNLVAQNVGQRPFSTVGTLNFTERKGNYEAFCSNLSRTIERTRSNEVRVTDIAHRYDSTVNVVSTLAKSRRHGSELAIVPHWTLTTSSDNVEKAREDKLEWLRSYVEDYGVTKVFLPKGNARTAQQEHIRLANASTSLRLLWEPEEIFPLIRQLYPDLTMSFAGYPDGHIETQKAFSGDRKQAMRHDLLNLKRKLASLGDKVEIAMQHSYNPVAVESYIKACAEAGIGPDKIALSFFPLHLWNQNMAYTMNKAGGVQLPEDIEKIFAEARDMSKDPEQRGAFNITHEIEQYLFQRSLELFGNMQAALKRQGVDKVLIYTNNEQEKVVQFFDKAGLNTHGKLAAVAQERTL